MKLVIAAILIVLSVSAFANTFEVDLNLAGGEPAYQLVLEKPITNDKQVGVFVYAMQCGNWAEAYVGPELNGSVDKVNYQLAYGAGIETGDKYRHGGWLWIGKDKLSAIALYEDGGSGPWKKFEVKYAVADKLSLGYVTRSFDGSGPLAEYKLSKVWSTKMSFFNQKTEFALTGSF